jgi:opacity protein-like surface antigen
MNTMLTSAITLAVLLNAAPAIHAQKPAPQPAAQAPASKPAPPKPAAAPPPPAGRWTDVATIAVNGGYQAGGSAFSDSFTFDQHLEQASMTARYPKKDGAAYGGGVTFRLWRNLGVGVSVSVANRSTTGDVNGTVPHPFHYRTNRAVAATVPLAHDETAGHLSAAYVVPAGGRLLLTVSAGPSYFSVKQSLVQSVSVDESYPYDEATLRTPVVVSTSKSVWGFHAGADAAFYFTRSIGIGVGVRYAGATLSMPSRGGTVSVKAGGAQVGAGLRIRIPKTVPRKKGPVKPAAPVKVGVKHRNSI